MLVVLVWVLGLVGGDGESWLSVVVGALYYRPAKASTSRYLRCLLEPRVTGTVASGISHRIGLCI